MKPSTAHLALAVALTTALTSLAQAGGNTARVEGPFKDGTYLVHTLQCGAPASMSVTATAEGKVSGHRRSVPLKLTATTEKGVYQFARTWPNEGTWIVRVTPANRDRAAVTLAAIASDGSVGENEFVWKSDGRHECDQKLAANTK